MQAYEFYAKPKNGVIPIPERYIKAITDEVMVIVLKKKQLTENGYTPEYEATILAEAEETYAAIRNGTAKTYRNTAEMFAEWDKEDAEDDD
ncbi:MAG: hypothetical protein LBI54_03195 [Lachnospiraceae bacterium]|jgi:hypothetical protein|nr:hypothetical protein [Lachnospiraceae bacterium]